MVVDATSNIIRILLSYTSFGYVATQKGFTSYWWNWGKKTSVKITTSLEEIKIEYREVETQAYWVLKKWQENNTSNAHQDYLHNVLQTLRFHKAAEIYLFLLEI